MDKGQAENLLQTFLEVVKLADCALPQDGIRLQISPPGECPRTLHEVKIVYAFILGNLCIKVGKAAPRTRASGRLRNHYNPRDQGALAFTILHNTERLKAACSPVMRPEVDRISETNVKSWMTEHITCVWFEMDRSADNFTVGFLEAFLQYKLRPLFEGKAQK